MKKIALSALVIAASGAYVWSQAGTTDPLLNGMAGADMQTGSIALQPASATGGMDVAPREVPFVTGGTEAAAPAQAPVQSAAQAPADAQPLPPLPAPEDSFAPAASQTTPAAPPPADNAPANPPVPTSPVVVATAEPPADPVPAPPAADTVATVPMPRLRPPYRQAAAAPTNAPSSAPSSAGAPLVRVAASTSGLNDGTYAGPVVDAYYGLMQIEAVVRNGRLTTIHVLRYPNDRRTSIYINRQALPMLRDEVIRAQSARVDIISGATLSSHAFIQSLGAALDKAHA